MSITNIVELKEISLPDLYYKNIDFKKLKYDELINRSSNKIKGVLIKFRYKRRKLLKKMKKNIKKIIKI